MRRFALLAAGSALLVASCATSDVAGDKQAAFQKLMTFEGHVAGDKQAALQKLMTFEGHDLQKNRDEVVAVDELLAELVPGRPRRESAFLYFAPWRVARVGSDSRTRVVVFEGAHCICIPGESQARVTVFDPAGRFLSSTAFSTGWRIDIGGVKISDAPQGHPLIDVSSGPEINGADVGRQLYSIVDDEVALIRLEAADGTALRNVYSYPNHQIGPGVPKRSVEAWEQALESGDRAEVLRTLIWLGGEHGRGASPGDFDVVTEQNDQAALVARLRMSDRVQAALAKLTKSDDSWVREAARQLGD